MRDFQEFSLNELRKQLDDIGRHRYIHKNDPLYFEKVLRYVDPHSPEAHYKVGEKQEKLGNLQKAVFHYEEVVRVPSPYYERAHKALEQLPASLHTKNVIKKEERPFHPLLLSLVITLLLFNFILLFFLIVKNHEVSTPLNTSSIEIEAVSNDNVNPVKLLSVNEQKKNEPLLTFSTNLVRTALKNYMNERGTAPTEIGQLLKDYPNNDISFIPLEVISGKNEVVEAFTGEGGWVYDASSETIEEMFYPNIDYEHIPFHPVTIVIGKSDYTLLLVSGSYAAFELPIGLGKENRTPLGTFTITERVLEPKGIHEKMYGEAGLSMGDIAIHGTYDEDSIGANKSLGCIRMGNDDIKALFSFVPKGTTVEITDDTSHTHYEAMTAGEMEKLIPLTVPSSIETADNTIFNWLN
jgi:hypothetical protein